MFGAIKRRKAREEYLYSAIYFVPIGVRSSVIRVSVCLSAHISQKRMSKFSVHVTFGAASQFSCDA